MLAYFRLTSTHLRQTLLSTSSYTDGGSGIEKLNNLTKLAQLVSNGDDLNSDDLNPAARIRAHTHCITLPLSRVSYNQSITHTQGVYRMVQSISVLFPSSLLSVHGEVHCR